MVKFKTVAASIGLGLAAGLAGTAAMTASSTLEARIRSREPSTAPADAAAKILGVRPEGDKQRARFSTVVHWSYGTAWGAARGLLAAVGLAPVPAFVLHLVALWGTEQVMLPALDVAPPLTRWGAKEIAIDGAHHVVYATATSVAYQVLESGCVTRALAAIR